MREGGVSTTQALKSLLWGETSDNIKFPLQGEIIQAQTPLHFVFVCLLLSVVWASLETPP